MTYQLNTRRDASCVLVIAVFLAAPEFALADAVPRADTTDYMHARYYSPNLGRFVSVDEVGGRVGSSQSWNRYSYANNSPIRLVDPDGKFDRDGLAERQKFLDSLPPERQAELQTANAKVAGAVVAVSISLALAPETLGATLVVGALASVSGGVTSRGIDADASTVAFDSTSMATDATIGAVSNTVAFGALEKTGAGKVIQGVAGGSDDALGAGVARVTSEAFSNTIAPFVQGEIQAVSEGWNPGGTNPGASDPSVNCHLTAQLSPPQENVTTTETWPLVSSH